MKDRRRQEDSIDDLLDRLNQMYGADSEDGNSSVPTQESGGSGELDPELRRLLEQAIAEGEGDLQEPSAEFPAEDLPEHPAGEERGEISARTAELFSLPTERDENHPADVFPAEEPSEEESSAEESSAEEPSEEEPSVEGLPAEEILAEEPSTEEPSAEEPPTEVSPLETPVSDDLVPSVLSEEPLPETEEAPDLVESSEDKDKNAKADCRDVVDAAIREEILKALDEMPETSGSGTADAAEDTGSLEDFSTSERSPELAPWEDTPVETESAQILADAESSSVVNEPAPAENPVSVVAEPEVESVLEEEPVFAEAEAETAPDEEPVSAETVFAQEEPVSVSEELLSAEKEPAAVDEGSFPEEVPAPVAAPATDGKQPSSSPEKTPVKSSASGLPPEFRDGRILTDGDIRMLLDLGYERELADFIGYDRIDLVRREGTGVSTPSGVRRRKKKKNKPPRNRNGNLAEYTDRDQNYEMRTRFRERRLHLYIRFAGTLLFAVLLLIYDMPRLFGISGFGALNPEKVPGLYAFFGLQLLLLSAVLSFPQILRGIRRAAAFEADLYFMPILFLLFNAVYDVLLLVFSKSGVPNLFHFVTVLYLLFAIGGELLLLCREEMTFDTVSAEGNRYTLEHVGYNEADGAVYQVRKTGFLSGTLARMRAEEPLRILNILSYAAVLFSLLMSAGEFILSGELTEAVSVFMKSLTLTTPLCSCIAFTLPQFFMTKELHKRGCSVIGDASVQEYSSEKTVMFREEDIFKAGSRIGFSSAGRRKLAEQFGLCGALFKKLGGTLGSVLDLSVRNAEEHERVEIGEIGEDGLTATVGAVNAVLGSASYLRTHGIALPPESAERAYLRRSDCVPLYVAFDREVSLIFEMTYRVGEETEQMIHNLAGCGTHVGVNVTDPCLTTPFVWRLRRLEPEHIKLCRVSHVLGDESFRSIDGGISARRAKDLEYPLVACRRLGQTRKTVTGILGLSAGLSALFVAVLLFTRIMPYLTPLMIALYQLIWLAPVAIASGSRLNLEGKYNE